MKKSLALPIVLVAVSLLFGVYFSTSVSAQNGACLNVNNPAYFCGTTDVSSCCGSDTSCAANYFYPNAPASPSSTGGPTGLCYNVQSCCQDSCTVPKSANGYYSPLLCANQSAFINQACSTFSQCQYGCVFCSGNPKSIGWYSLSVGRAQCLAIGQTLTYFYQTNDATQCGVLTQPAAATYTINGTVTSASVAIQGATVTAAGITTSTDASGFYKMSGAPSGTYTITASAAGYQQNTTTISVSGNITQNLVLQQSTTATLTVTVQDASGIVSGATVELSSSSFDQKATTGTNGQVTFYKVPTGAYTIAASTATESGSATETLAAGLKAVTVTISTAQPPTPPPVPTPTPSQATLSINVFDQNNNVVPDAAVAVSGAPISFNGVNYSSSPLSVPNTYTISITKTGYTSITDTVDLTANANVSYTLTPVVSYYSISGNVRNTAGNAVDSALVYLKTGSLISTFALTDSLGHYSLALPGTSGLPPGTYTVVVSKTGYLDYPKTITITTSNIQQDFVLQNSFCYTQIDQPNITGIVLNKSSIVISFTAGCAPSGFYVYRGQSGAASQPITNALNVTSYTDGNISSGTTYTYQVLAYYTTPYVRQLLSNPVSISTGAQECFDNKGELCENNQREYCDGNNTLHVIPPPGQNYICRYINETSTEYVPTADCSQCNPPLGSFYQSGQMPIATSGGTVYVGCNSTDFVNYPQLKNCFVDYTNTAVNKYYDCGSVKSCYDYKSQSACQENRCVNNTPCEWQSSYSSLGLGVCRPKDEKKQDCNACNSIGKYNKVFGQCTQQLCGLYANFDPANNAGCYFNTQTSTCVNRRDVNCETYFTNKTDCTGANNVPVSLDVAGQNEILQNSSDNMSLGLCRWSATYALGRCSKDANNDSAADSNPADMTPPFTVVVHPPAANAINFPVVVYDDENLTALFVPTATRFLVLNSTASFKAGDTRSWEAATNGNITDFSITDGNYTVYFYSEDRANNLEVVKSFNVTIDTTPPSIFFSYTTSNGLAVTLASNEIVRCAAQLQDQNGNVVQPQNNLDGTVPQLQFVSNYASVPDGLYYYTYTCTDWVGNPTAAKQPIVVDSDNIITNLLPNGTINYNSVTLSVNTVTQSSCVYGDSNTYPNGILDNLFASASPFSTNDNLHHFVSGVNVPGINTSATFYVRCKILATGQLTKNPLKAIRFTVDEQPPQTLTVVPQNLLNPAPYDISVWRSSEVFKLMCSDPQISGGTAYGCATLNYCFGALPCSPTPAKNTSQILSITNYGTLCYFSVDNGGNAENGGQPICTTVNVDNTPPVIQASFVGTNGRVGTDGIRVNTPTINVSGTVFNYAFYKANFSGDTKAPFDNFTLTSSVSVSQQTPVAAIAFDYQNSNSFDSAQIDFLNKQISVNGITEAVPTLAPGIPAQASLSATGSSANFTVNGVSLVGTRAGEAGRIILSNDSNWTSVAILDNTTTSPAPANVTVKLNGGQVGSATLNPDGTFLAGSVDVSSLFNNPGYTGVLELDSTDNASNTGKLFLPITIDISGPQTPPHFDPPIDDSKNALGDNYKSLEPLGYELWYDSSTNTYYTNQKNLWISGYTDEKPVNLSFYVNGAQQGAEYQEMPITNFTDPASFKSKFTTPAGSTSFTVSGDFTPFLSRISGDKYVQFAGHIRKSYGNYSEFYKISGYVPSGQGDTIVNLTSPLEQSVASGEQFWLINGSSRAYNRFLTNISLSNGSDGTEANTFYLNQFDDLRNSGASTDKISVFVDTVPPQINSSSPDFASIANFNSNSPNQTYTLQSLNGISMQFTERGSGLRPNASITINGVAYLFNVTVTPSSNPLQNTYTLSYPNTLVDGVYNISISVRDKAGNLPQYDNSSGGNFVTIPQSWTFDINSQLPRAPIILLSDPSIMVGQESPDNFTFVRPGTSPAFNVTYPDTEYVNISFAQLVNLNTGAPVGGIGLNITRLGTARFLNTYQITLYNITNEAPANISTSDYDYELQLYSFKTYSDGTTGPATPSPHTFHFSVDTTPPGLSNFYVGSPVRNDAPIKFSVDISGERHPLKASATLTGYIFGSSNTVGVINVTSETLIDSLFGYLSPTDVSRVMHAPLLDNQNYTIQLNVSDYAGNYNDGVNGTIFVDNEFPQFGAININAFPLHVTVANFGNETYTVREDLINITGSVSDNYQPSGVASGVRQISFYRGNSLVASPITQCSPPNTVNCILSSGSFTFKASSIVIGKIGFKETNNIFISATDLANNTNTVQKVIYRDLEKPRVQVCVELGTNCTAPETNLTPVVTDTNEMISECGSNQDCYNALITAACATDTSPTTCYMNYIVKIDHYELYPLCENTALLRDQCYYNLALATKVATLCQYIQFSTLATKCVAQTTG